jgi:hypothetical protein
MRYIICRKAWLLRQIGLPSTLCKFIRGSNVIVDFDSEDGEILTHKERNNKETSLKHGRNLNEERAGKVKGHKNSGFRS